MTYVSWAALYEGATDQAYFEVLIPRVMEDIILQFGIRNSTISPTSAIKLKRDEFDKVVREACLAQDAFHVLFIHADTGGRSVEEGLHGRSVRYCEAMNETCDFSLERCVSITPRHEVEAWVLADPEAIANALGVNRSNTDLEIPKNAVEAERLVDPKSVLTAAAAKIRGRRRSFDARQLYPAIAQRQSLACLRVAPSFVVFEKALRKSLASLGCVGPE